MIDDMDTEKVSIRGGIGGGIIQLLKDKWHLSAYGNESWTSATQKSEVSTKLRFELLIVHFFVKCLKSR